ncbi:hypothetical protein TNIN_92341 [Trichonephila inaurata madagascariensis]|uniref:Uncharacterized protein n=1 Tax=Trichonephila inaurata madagascariensis TaxID=2747483 RepID=A0A8X6YC56_9ARAC|nr:hypothetical protein TNIN_92341 [Trichonephila inaurata madagascariensis]
MPKAKTKKIKIKSFEHQLQFSSETFCKWQREENSSIDGVLEKKKQKKTNKKMLIHRQLKRTNLFKKEPFCDGGPRSRLCVRITMMTAIKTTTLCGRPRESFVTFPTSGMSLPRSRENFMGSLAPFIGMGKHKRRFLWTNLLL